MLEIWRAVPYALKTGCRWRALPGDFPKWSTADSRFSKWIGLDEEGESLLAQALKKMRLTRPAGNKGRKAKNAKRATHS